MEEFKRTCSKKMLIGMIRNGGAELFIWFNSRQKWRSETYQGGAFILFLGKYFNFSYISIYDGIVIGIALKVLVWNEADQKLVLMWLQQSDLCHLYNYCGANAICDIKVGFTPKFKVYWDLHNFCSGCEPPSVE